MLWVLWIALGLAADSDGDGFDDADGSDNCPGLANPDQADLNADGYGDACVHPTATVSPSAVLLSGARVRERSIVGDNTQLGIDSIIGARTRVGENTTIGSTVIIGRSVVVGDRAQIGDDATLSRNATIGDDAVVGMNTAVGYAVAIESGASVGDNSVLGSLSRVSTAATVGDWVVVARSAQVDTCASLATFTLLGPETTVGAFAELGASTRVRRGSAVGQAAQLGSNTRVGRDASVGPSAHVATSGAIRANAQVPTCMEVSSGATLQRGETATSTASECTVVLSEDQGGDDIWTTSVFAYDGVSQRPGGGSNNNLLLIGGWGDTYLSLLEFDIAGLPGGVTSARIDLYRQSRASGTTTNFYVDRVTSSWDYRSGGTGRDTDRLWWTDRPSTTSYSGAITPVAAENWQPIDITGLYNNWSNGTWANHGVSLRPTSTSNRWVVFESSNACTDDLCSDRPNRELGDQCRAPRLVLTP